LTQFSDRNFSEIVRQRIQFGASLRVKGLGACVISALEVEDRYRGLNQSLDRDLFVAFGSIPHVLPRFMAFEELTGIEEIDAFLEVVARLGSHREDDRTFSFLLEGFVRSPVTVEFTILVGNDGVRGIFRNGL